MARRKRPKGGRNDPPIRDIVETAMTEDSPLRRLIQQQRTTALGEAQVQAAERESELSIANEIPGWERAKQCLDEAIQQANADYAAEAVSDEFRYEGHPQPGLGNSVYAVIVHSGGRNRVSSFSETGIAVQRDGRVMVSAGGCNLCEFPVSTVSSDDWRDVLLKIYVRDSGS
jgi:hypothetical protein